MDHNMFFALEIYENEQNIQKQRKPRVYVPREDPRVVLSDFKFKQHFRFCKESVNRLTQILHADLNFESERGLPISIPASLHIIEPLQWRSLSKDLSMVCRSESKWCKTLPYQSD